MWMQTGEVHGDTDKCVYRFSRIKYVFRWEKSCCFSKGLNVSGVQKSLFPHHSKHQKLLCYSRVGAFLTCLFVSASDELIGAGADWLLLREGGNFSVILWLIIALKYVTVPTPSEVFDRRLWCVFRQAGRQTGRQLSGTHSAPPSHTSASDCLLQTPVCCKVLLQMNKVFEKNDSTVITACLLEPVRVLYAAYMCCSGSCRHTVWENIKSNTDIYVKKEMCVRNLQTGDTNNWLCRWSVLICI